jgi:hypothetical protein
MPSKAITNQSSPARVSKVLNEVFAILTINQLPSSLVWGGWSIIWVLADKANKKYPTEWKVVGQRFKKVHASGPLSQ